jgi:hypothetical protein
MTVGIASDNVDLSLIFAPYTPGRTQAASVFIRTGSGILDLSTQFENIIYGTGPSDTGITSGAGDADIATIYCAAGTSWTASLPTFPHPFTQTPQPYPSGSLSMSVTLTGGPGGTYTYLWTYTDSGSGGNDHFYIDSGQGTGTIMWHATGTSAEPSIISVTCKVTATNGAYVQATTTMRFNVP